MGIVLSEEKREMRGNLRFPSLALLLMATTAFEATGAVVTFQASYEFSGGTAPTGAPPWLTASFDDHGATGSVTMTLTATNLTGNEFVSGWYLNLSPALNPGDLVFSSPTKIGSFTDPTVGLGADLFKADGDGSYDILLSFLTSDGLSSRFSAGDSVSYVITGISSLTASSFDCLGVEESGAGYGPFPMAAHVQGIGPDSASGWVTVPEPACICLLLLGGLAAMRRRR
jgi:hypothetical protein